MTMYMSLQQYSGIGAISEPLPVSLPPSNTVQVRENVAQLNTELS